MFDLTRRDLIRSAAAAGLGSRLLRAAPPAFKVGVTDWNLRLGAKTDSVALAKQLGFDGVQLSFGRQLVNDKLPVDSPEVIAQYKKLSAEHKIPLDGTCVDRLHENGIKSDPLAVRWVRDSIRLTRELGVQVLLIPMFGRWAIQNAAERDYVGDALRELGPEAEKAGVILGLEDTISAEDNVRIMDRSRSKAVLVYYDVGNSTNNGFDVVKEIRWLGKSRICQIHLKDNPNYMGEGKIDFVEVVKAMRDIGYTGYANLETNTKQGSTVEADMKRNLSFIRGVMSKVS
jgi:sugar phosphate isomerase/epimerase